MKNKQNYEFNKKLHLNFSKIPSVEEILQQGQIQSLISRYSRKMITPLIRLVLEDERKRIVRGCNPAFLNEIVDRCIFFIGQEYHSYIRPVINGTGVILHTNLGRAMIGEGVIKDALSSLQSYNNLEYDLFQGIRGKRGDFVERMLVYLSQAESAAIVNNNAAAVYLILKTLAQDRNVIISRGELVQIGGGFRIPDILKESGAILKEIGTTNQTILKDYQGNIDEKTALILKVHQSNFSITGFTREVGVKELSSLTKKHKIPLVVDLGSGTFLPTESFQLDHEPTVQETIRAGADIVCFSGDKLLGGPQAGIVCGKEELVHSIRNHPMYRTFRVGKTIMALLQFTLLSYLKGTVLQDLTVWQMFSLPYETIKKRCHAVARKLKQLNIPASCHDGVSLIGGGSMPGQQLPTRLLYIESGKKVKALEKKLRMSYPALLGRVKDGYFIIDLRTIALKEEKTLSKLISSAYQDVEKDIR